MANLVSFDQVKKAKLKRPIEKVFEMEPHLIGLDASVFEMGLDDKGKPNTRVAIKFRGITLDEYNEILNDVKGIDDATERRDEMDFAILQKCLVEPAIPPTADGRRYLESWAPGTIQNVRVRVEIEGGWRNDYVVKDASAQLKNSSASTPTDTSS